MTERLYYTDPYTREFDATVVAVDSQGGRTLVTLDRTAFYPTSGGQPYDTGSLAGARVLDVFDSEDASAVVHAIDHAGGLEAGRTVHGAIDWDRRFDHMQQHTGQHVLSASFDQLFEARTVSFHLGSESATIDLSRELTAAELTRAEDQANAVVWENRPVAIRFVTSEEAATLPLRKEPARDGTLRLIAVEGFDLSACGGTHVSRTGAIGVIAVSSWERFKGGLRIEFVCGGRALNRLRMLRDAVAGTIRLLSVAPGELPAAVERLQGEAKDQKRTMTALQIELARYRAEALVSAAQPSPKGLLVVAVVEGDAAALKAMASTITSRPGHIAVLVSRSTPALAVVARSADVDVQANRVLAELTTKFGGRGGGKPDLAQGGGLSGAPDEILSVARRLLIE